MQKQIIFIKSGANSLFGGFAPGDKARVSPEFARHLVDETGVAVYAEKQKPAEIVVEPQKQRGRPKKHQ